MVLNRSYNQIMNQIDAPADEVFRRFCELDSWPGWFSYVESARFKPKHAWRVGDQFVIKIKMPYLPLLKLKLTLLEVVENELIIWGQETAFGFQKHEFHFKKVSDAQMEILNKEWSGGLMSVLNFLPGFFISHVNRCWSRDIAAAF